MGQTKLAKRNWPMRSESANSHVPWRLRNFQHITRKFCSPCKWKSLQARLVRDQHLALSGDANARLGEKLPRICGH